MGKHVVSLRWCDLRLEFQGDHNYVRSEYVDLFGSPVGFSKSVRNAERFVSLALRNSINVEILRRLPSLGLAEWWLTSGCLFQSAWNVMLGRDPRTGILDYDVFYYDPDCSWEAEDRAIRASVEVFSDLKVNVQLRNQARVHLWYEDKFGLRYPPLRMARHAVRRFPSRVAAVAITATSDGGLIVYAPFGFRDTLMMVSKPNKWLDIPDVYENKTSRWAGVWGTLKVFPWHDGFNSTGDSGISEDGFPYSGRASSQYELFQFCD